MELKDVREQIDQLDRELVAVVAALIKEHAAGRLVLLVSHDSELDELIADCEIAVQ